MNLGWGMYCTVSRELILFPTTYHRSLNIHSIHGPVVNPFQPASDTPWEEREKRSTGGSSGGSAAAVAAGMCHALVSPASFPFVTD